MTQFYDQLTLSKGKQIGDCWRVCIASLVGIAPRKIPHFVEIEVKTTKHHIDQTQKWLNARGLRLNFDSAHPGWICICVDESPRGGRHAIIVDENNLLLHDPHPSKIGVIEKEPRFFWIEKLPSPPKQPEPNEIEVPK